MKKLILLLLLLFSLNIYAEEKTIIVSHPVIYARIKVKASENIRYDKISDFKYKIIDGEPTILVGYNGTIFDIIEIKGKELCEEFIKELEDFNYYLKCPKQLML